MYRPSVIRFSSSGEVTSNSIEVSLLSAYALLLCIFEYFALITTASRGLLGTERLFLLPTVVRDM